MFGNKQTYNNQKIKKQIVFQFNFRIRYANYQVSVSKIWDESVAFENAGRGSEKRDHLPKRLTFGHPNVMCDVVKHYCTYH